MKRSTSSSPAYTVAVEWWYNNGSCTVVCNVIYPSSETEDTKYYPINKFHAHIYMLMRLKKKFWRKSLFANILSAGTKYYKQHRKTTTQKAMTFDSYIKLMT